MLVEKLNKWTPCEGLSSKYRLDSIYNDGCFNMVLIDVNDPTKKILIDYSSSPVYLEQKTALSFREKTLRFLRECYGKEFVDQWTFFKIDNSQEKQWMTAQAIGIMDFDSFQHYVFITTNYFIEFVAPRDPLVEHLQSERQIDDLRLFDTKFYEKAECNEEGLLVDFHRLKPTNISTFINKKGETFITGTLPDESIVTAKIHCKDTRPSLSFQKKDKSKIRICYGPKPKRKDDDLLNLLGIKEES